ncbi:tyrosine-type recombinase/integrase [Cupriavidus sp. TKC]|uniref:tyrosine-type recombinase/integrase n=1 Tax=Cupriavidus sp. TKC TaxID=2880159 RepID=UPI00295F1F6C|nr:tyrosine-type recombinase/integrase [Cupriavidus sp. TKC]
MLQFNLSKGFVLRGQAQNAERIARRQLPLPDLRAVRYVDHLEPMYLLMRDTALSMHDCATLTIGDIDLKEGRLLKRTRDYHERWVPLSELARSTCIQWRSQTDGQLLFAGKSPETTLDIRGAWHGLVSDAGFAEVNFSALRRDFMMRLLKHGAERSEILFLIGRSPPREERRLTAHNMATLRKLVEKASRALLQP